VDDLPKEEEKRRGEEMEREGEERVRDMNFEIVKRYIRDRESNAPEAYIEH